MRAIDFQGELKRFLRSSEIGHAIDTAKAVLDGALPEPADSDLDAMERVAAALIVAVRKESLRRAGWQVRPWGRNGPAVRRLSHGTYEGPRGGCFDHSIRLANRDGRTVYLTEPYGLSAGALRDALDIAEREGWDVRIDERCGLHFPGRTAPVVFTKKGGE